MSNGKQDSLDLPGLRWPRVIPWAVVIALGSMSIGVAVGYGGDRAKLNTIQEDLDRLRAREAAIEAEQDELHERFNRLEKSVCTICLTNSSLQNCPVCN